MPYNPASPCRYALCPRMAIKGSGYCEIHQKNIKIEKVRPVAGSSTRPSAAKRGYGWSWQKLRDWYIKQNPLCEMCRAAGMVYPAAVVHHKKRLKDNLDLRLYIENLQSLCVDCHAKVTAEEKKADRNIMPG